MPLDSEESDAVSFQYHQLGLASLGSHVLSTKVTVYG